MGIAGRKEPQVSLLDVVNKWFAVLIQARYSRVAVKHKRPFACRVPMQLAYTARRQTHIDACDRFRDRQVRDCHLAGPTALLRSLVRKRKRIFEGFDVSVISWRRRH